ncbi:MAG: DUF4199 domain-containing protein [Lysobacteraceae bacterium]|nr:MAG: DUF4199 domain-containing protein [Xanthomonadaceae bacterium]
MLKTILLWGTVAGLIVGSILFGTTVTMADDPPPMAVGMVLGYTSMLIALSAIFVGVKRYRDYDRGGVIRFWPAFGMGLGISLVAGVFYVLAWEAALAVTGMDYMGEYAKHVVEERKAAGASAAELAKVAAEMESFRVQYDKPLFRMPMTFTEIFPVGVLVSLITAALLRKPDFLPRKRVA